MQLNIYQIDAFAEHVFAGNPAAVCPLDAWLDDGLLQQIAQENNLSETAFFVATDRGFQLRWFTPVKEIDLCGHATLAAAFVLYQYLGYSKPYLIFESKSGDLKVAKTKDGFCLDFPADTPHFVQAPQALLSGLGIRPQAVLAATDYMVVLNNEAEVKALKPDLQAWQQLDLRGVVVTARGNDVAVVSRCFFPKYGIDEDPVTGSAHCALMPYWGGELGVQKLRAYQCSARGGYILCEQRKDRVLLTGQAVAYMSGSIVI